MFVDKTGVKQFCIKIPLVHTFIILKNDELVLDDYRNS